jgi:ABC-type antimicrobial peptide transport system permease subunit
MNALPISPVVLAPLVLFVVLLGGLLVAGKVPLNYNLRNLVVRWRMSFLTGLAFTLVIGLLVVMMAFVNGMDRLTEGSGHADNVVVLAQGSNDETFSSLNFSETSDLERQPGIMTGALPETKGKPLASREVYVIANMPVPPEEGKTAGPKIQGKVGKVLIDQNAFILTDEQGNDRTFHLADTGKVFANNVEGKLENLKPGDTIWMAYEDRGSDSWATEIRGSNRRRFVQIRGIEDPLIAAEVHRLSLFPGGQWFNEAGVEELPAIGKEKKSETAVQAVIGEGLAWEMGPDVQKERLEVGDVFELGPKKYKVVGILMSAGTTFNSEVWAKRSYIGELYGKPNTISVIVLRTPSAAEASRLAKELPESYQKAFLTTQTETEYYSKLQGITTRFKVAIILLTVFMAIGGIFGLMNTMFAVISQRIKDIGVLRILGYARWQILASFLLESLGIALLGGLVGCALGALSHGFSATSIVGSGQGGFGKTVIFRLVVDASTLGIGLLLTLFMGFLGGLLPSLNAMRLKPLESLR